MRATNFLPNVANRIPDFSDYNIWGFSTTLLLKKLPNEVRGRVFGTEFALLTLAGAIGSGLGGWLHSVSAYKT